MVSINYSAILPNNTQQSNSINFPELPKALQGLDPSIEQSHLELGDAYRDAMQGLKNDNPLSSFDKLNTAADDNSSPYGDYLKLSGGSQAAASASGPNAVAMASAGPGQAFAYASAGGNTKISGNNPAGSNPITSGTGSQSPFNLTTPQNANNSGSNALANAGGQQNANQPQPIQFGQQPTNTQQPQAAQNAQGAQNSQQQQQPQNPMQMMQMFMQMMMQMMQMMMQGAGGQNQQQAA